MCSIESRPFSSRSDSALMRLVSYCGVECQSTDNAGQEADKDNKNSHNPCYVNHSVDKKLESNTQKAMHMKRIIMI